MRDRNGRFDTRCRKCKQDGNLYVVACIEHDICRIRLYPDGFDMSHHGHEDSFKDLVVRCSYCGIKYSLASEGFQDEISPIAWQFGGILLHEKLSDQIGVFDERYKGLAEDKRNLVVGSFLEEHGQLAVDAAICTIIDAFMVFARAGGIAKVLASEMAVTEVKYE